MSRERTGPVLKGIAPSDVYPTADGEILIAANQDSLFARLCDVMGRPDLARDPRFADHRARVGAAEELDALLCDWTRPTASHDLLRVLHAASVPAGLVYTPADMAADPHLQARRPLVEVDDPEIGPLLMPAPAPRLSRTPCGSAGPAPAWASTPTRCCTRPGSPRRRRGAALRRRRLKPRDPPRKDTMPTPEITAALHDTDEAIGRLDQTLAGLSDGDLHLAHHDGGWTAAQLVSHVNMSVLLWTATLTRVASDPELTFVFREEIGHDVFGYPPPRIETARRQLSSTRRTLATCVRELDPAILEREIEIPDLGTLTIAVWTPPVLGHAAGHCEQALNVLRDRGAIA